MDLQKFRKLKNVRNLRTASRYNWLREQTELIDRWPGNSRTIDHKDKLISQNVATTKPLWHYCHKTTCISQCSHQEPQESDFKRFTQESDFSSRGTWHNKKQTVHCKHFLKLRQKCRLALHQLTNINAIFKLR